MESTASFTSRSFSRLSIYDIGQYENDANGRGLLLLNWWNIKYGIREEKVKKPSLRRRIFYPRKAKQEMEALRKETEKQILKGVVGEVRPGQMVALMGSSGAGKTTLLNILAGRIVGGTPTGTVQINGKPRNPKSWRKITSYVEQFDILDGNLTVREMIRFAAHIKLPDSLYSSAEKDKKAERMIEALGLGNIADSIIDDGSGHHISGGQRKRVSIAIELISEKKLIFLDEPTTGLDATTSLALIQTIKELTKKYNLSVVMAIHQPRKNILEHFDRILLLSLGKTIFFGNLIEILDHFNKNGFQCHEEENPADFIIDVVSLNNESVQKKLESQRRILYMQDQWDNIEKDILKMTSHRDFLSKRSSRKSLLFSRPIIPDSLDRNDFEWPVNRFKEFRLLLVRHCKVEFRNQRGITKMFLEFIFFALVLGFIFFQLTTENFGGFQSRLGLLNFVQGYLMIISVEMAISWTIYKRVMIRERANNTYRTSSTYFAKFLSQLPVRIFSVICFGTILYYIAGLRTNTFTAYLIFIALLVSTYLCSICFGIAVSTITKTESEAIVTDLFLVFVFIMYSGFIVNSESISHIVSWLRFLSPMFYALQGFIQNEANGLIIAGQPADVYVNDYSLNQISVPWCIGALLFYSLGFFGIGLLGFHISTKPRYIII